MARPRKEGMDYFPHDTNALGDKKIEALRMLYGNDGYAFYFIMLEMIYQEPSFELDVSDAETIQILSKKVGINTELFNQILSTAIKRECFDRESYYERKVLTSNGIKKRASVVVEKREKMRKKYEDKVSDAENKEEKPQSKVKESKVKESKEKVKEKKIHYSPNVSLTKTEHQKLCNEYGDKLTESCITYLHSYKIEKNYTTKSDYLTIKRWVVEAVKRSNMIPFRERGGQADAKHGTGHAGRTDDELNAMSF